MTIEQKVIVRVKCPICGQTTYLEVKYRELCEYRSGKLVQDAFPDLSTEERELILTGMCRECQAKTFEVAE